MSTRERLKNRRGAQLFDLYFRGGSYTIAASKFDDGRVAEVFITAHKQSTDLAADARDAAIMLSLALQHGAPIGVLRKAVNRAEDGSASGIAGATLDLLHEEGFGG